MNQKEYHVLTWSTINGFTVASLFLLSLYILFSFRDGQKACWSDICVERQILRYGFWANNQPQSILSL